MDREKDYLSSLPVEILERVLLSTPLDYRDVIALASTCSRLFGIVTNSEVIMRNAFSRDFPELYEWITTRPKDGTVQWFGEYKQTTDTKRWVWKTLEFLSHQWFHKDELSNSDHTAFVTKIQEYPRCHLHVLYALADLIQNTDSRKHLTLKHYARSVLRYMKHVQLREDWKKLLEEEDPSYEVGLTVFAQWFQPTSFTSAHSVQKHIDNIALDVIDNLRILHPSHPLFANIQKQKDEDRERGIVTDDRLLPRFSGEVRRHQWSPKESGLVIQALNQTLYVQHGFSGDSLDYYDLNNSFIDQVLVRKRGIPITLCCLYMLIAKRLGVVCEPINYPNHFYLRYYKDPDDLESWVFIDAFNSGTQKIPARVAIRMDQELRPARPIEIFQRMTRNFIHIGNHNGAAGLKIHRSSLELMKLIGDETEVPGYRLCRVYMQLRINQEEVLEELKNYRQWPEFAAFLHHDIYRVEDNIAMLRANCLQQIEDLSRASSSLPTPKTRDLMAIHTNAEGEQFGFFAVGMVMKHKKYDYKCVIVGWDEVCKASKAWVLQMGVHNLPRHTRQPFYNVLVDDGSTRYAADENLELLDEAEVIDHEEVGKYFEEFNGRFYVMNAETRREYPEDEQVCENAVPTS